MLIFKDVISNLIIDLIIADVENAYIMVTSTLYFKGQWEMPFNVSATERRAFFDDSKHEIGYVQMMHQARPLPYSRIDSLRADALELPYGNVSGCTYY